MARDLMIGIDSSTTACKAVIWDQSGRAVANGRAPLPMLRPRPGWHEQPAAAWWTAACEALREAVANVDPARLAAACIAVQRETFGVVDSAGEQLGNALVWMDERARGLLPKIDRIYGKARVHQETGKPCSANLSLVKLLWLREEQPDIFRRIDRVLDVHAYLAQKLTGRCATSWGCADPMGLFDMRQNCWNADLIASIGLRVDQFPEALPVGAVVGEVNTEAARATGLPVGLPLFAGLGDGQAAGLGVCAVRPGETFLNLGTAVVSGAYSERYLVDPAFRTHYAGVPGAYDLETVLLGGTYTITWFLENFANITAEERALGRAREEIMEDLAAQVPPGALGLTLVPYWNSAMNPYWDAAASGVILGWRGVHGTAHLYRAILEGIALELRLQTRGVEEALGQPIERLIAVGGGARSDLWRQIIADVTGRPVYRANAPEATALGAGILAAVGAGLFPDVLEAARAMTHIDPQPLVADPERQAFYDRLYEEVYRKIYPALRESLESLANLAETHAL